MNTETLKELLANATPGPWEVGNTKVRPGPEPQANARLIALAPELAAEVIRLRKALQRLVDLNDNFSPFGGEIYQDRIVQAWDDARAALNDTPGPAASPSLG